MLSPLSGFGNPDDWWMTRSVDYYGTSIYPKHAAAATPWSPVRLTSALDGIRSAAGDRGWWIGELQAGQGATGVRVASPVTGADLRLWGWAAISRGARAISYYAWYPMSSGYESNGYGMIELDGTITDRARIAGEFAGVVGRNAALFAPLRPHPSKVAILYNRLSYLVGGNTVAPGTVVRNSMLGIYRALFEQNIQVDFIHPDDVVAGAASTYAVIYLSYPVMLQQPVADALKAYVRGGGTLISEARPAWNDERGLANSRIPGGGLDQTFGARERELRSGESMSLHDGVRPRRATRVVRRTHVQRRRVRRTPRRVSGTVLVCWRVLSATADVLAMPPSCSTPQGSGRAILIGTFPSAAFEQDPDKMRSRGELLQRLIASAGVAPEIRIEGGAGRVEARFLESSNAIVLIAINHGDAAERVTFNFGPDVPEAIWQNMETGRGRQLRAGSGRSDLCSLVRRARRDGVGEGEEIAIVLGEPRVPGKCQACRGCKRLAMKTIASVVVIAAAFAAFALQDAGVGAGAEAESAWIGESADRRYDDHHRLQPAGGARAHVVWIARARTVACGAPARTTARRFSCPRT